MFSFVRLKMIVNFMLKKKSQKEKKHDFSFFFIGLHNIIDANWTGWC